MFTESITINCRDGLSVIALLATELIKIHISTNTSKVMRTVTKGSYWE